MAVSTWPGDIRGLTFGAKHFVACGHTGQVLISADGAAWKEVLQTGDKHNDDAVRFASDHFWLRGEKSVRTSTDGEHWEEVKPAARLPRAWSPDGIAIACSWGGIDVAADGKSWKKATVPLDPTGICAVAWGVPEANLPKDADKKKRR